MLAIRRIASLCVLLAACPGTTLAADAPQAATLDDYAPPSAGQVRIDRDHYGVPHIVARDMRGLYFGAGYAQAEDQLPNLFLNYLRAEGRSAEREGTASLAQDHLTRQLRIPERAREHFAALDEQTRSMLTAFTDGVNAYLVEHRERVPEWIEPARPEQILAFTLYVETAFAVGNCRSDLQRAGVRLARAWPDPAETHLMGSNQFAVSPGRSGSGAAMLSMDPHLPLSGFYRWYEMHLVSDEVNVMGACFFGAPFISMGRTATSAWCMTVNGPDLGDVFAFTIDPDDPTRYRGLDGWESFGDSTETYRVLVGDQLEERQLPVRQTSLGPVMAEQDGTAYVFALPWPESSGRVRQVLEMARARNLAEFRQSLEPLGIVMFNIVYADAAGDIFYVSNGRIPRRDTRIDSRAIRPGDEAWARWQGYHPLAELPQVTNPPDGYLMNTNSGPQNVCPSAAPQPADYPPYMMSQQANSRSRRLSALLAADSEIHWDELRAIATDTHLIEADRLVPEMVALAALVDGAAGKGTNAADGDNANGGGTANGGGNAGSAARLDPADAPPLREALRVLEAWDRRTDIGSQGAVLFVLLATDNALRDALDAGDQVKAAARLAAVARRVAEQYEQMDASWGAFSRIRRGDLDVAIGGCGMRDRRFGDLTALRPSYGVPFGARRMCVGGTSYAMIVDFSGATQAESVLPFGISDDPSSPHFADQLPLYAEGRYKPAWFRPDEVRENTARSVVLEVPPPGGA